MSLRRNRKRRSLARRALGLWASWKLVRPAKFAAGAIALAAAAAMIRKRRARETQLPWGPPNEGVPSRETLEPSKDVAGKAA
jgi:hypothetical protein